MAVVFPETLQRRYSILATRSASKISEAEKSYQNQGELLALDPEALSGQPEADLPDVEEVAWLKTEIVKIALQTLIENHPGEVNEFFSDGVIIGVDVSVVINDVVELKKLSREMGWDDKAKIEQARTQTTIMFCQGAFHVVWKIGFAVRTMDGAINNVTMLQVESDFSPLSYQEVDQAFNQEEVLHDCSRVNLVELVSSHAQNLKITNEQGDEILEVDFSNPEDLQFMRSLIVGCVIPQIVINQLAEPVPSPEGDRFNKVRLLPDNKI